MADLEILTHRTTTYAAALATMGVCPIWDAALSRFLAAHALAMADSGFGVVAEATREFDRERMRLEYQFGTDLAKDVRAKQARDANFDKMQEAENVYSETYCKPLWAAETALARTPAPSLAAALYKATMIEAQDVWFDVEDPAELVGIVAADLARFTGEA